MSDQPQTTKWLTVTGPGGEPVEVPDDRPPPTPQMIERARCVAIVKRWFAGDDPFDIGYECIREIQNG